MTLMPLTFSSSAATVAVASATVTSSAARVPFLSPSLRRFVSFRLTSRKQLPPPLCYRGGVAGASSSSSLSVKSMSELVQDKESTIAASTSFNDADESSNTTTHELNHSRTFLDARSEQGQSSSSSRRIFIFGDGIYKL